MTSAFTACGSFHLRYWRQMLLFKRAADGIQVGFCRSVLAEAILKELLAGCGRKLDVSVASASVGPAPPGPCLSLYALTHSIQICALELLQPSCLGCLHSRALECRLRQW